MEIMSKGEVKMYKIAESLDHTTKMMEDILSSCIAAENRADNARLNQKAAQESFAKAIEELNAIESIRYNLCKYLKILGVRVPVKFTNFSSKYS